MEIPVKTEIMTIRACKANVHIGKTEKFRENF